MSRIPYDPTDDAAADRFINTMIRQPDARVWAELCGETFAEQTDRILHRIVDSTFVALGKRRADIEQARHKRTTRQITAAAYADELAEYEAWKLRTMHFQTLTRQYLRQTLPVVSRLQNRDMVDGLRKAVKTLSRAIAEHRASVAEDYEPTPADRMLWARLATVQVPTKSPTDLVSAGDHIGVTAPTSSVASPLPGGEEK